MMHVPQQAVAHLPEVQNVRRIQFTRMQIVFEHFYGRLIGQHVFQTVGPSVQVIFGHGTTRVSTRNATHYEFMMRFVGKSTGINKNVQLFFYKTTLFKLFQFTVYTRVH